nr:hypothetical protein [Leuven Sobemo-like virus 1]
MSTYSGVVVEPRLADRAWDLLLSPIVLFWAMIPTVVRVQFTRIPADVVHMILCLGWTVLVYYCLGYYMYSVITPYLKTPVFIEQLYNMTLVYKDQVEQFQYAAWWENCSWRNIVVFIYGSVAFIKLGINGLLGTPEPVATGGGWGLFSVPKGQKLPFIGERVMAGSDFIPAKTLPTFMARVLDAKGQLLGMAWRLENALITAAHVIQTEDEVIIQTEHGKVVVDSDRWQGWPLEDIVFIKMTPKEFSVLGLSTARLEPCTVEEGDQFFVQCHGTNSYSMGSVNHTPLFGKVVYSGSTAHGFSGAPYVSHKRVLGMHLGYGPQNIGVSSAYLALKFSTVDESSEDILMKQIAVASKRGKRIEYRISPGDPDEVEFKWGRGYRVLPRDEFFGVYVEEAMIHHSQDLAQRVAPKTIAGNEFVDSKNGSQASTFRSANVGASGKTLEMKSSVLKKQEPKPNSIPITMGQPIGKILDTEALASMHVPQRNRSGSMSSDTSFQPERKRNQDRRRRRRVSKLFADSTPAGQHGLQLIK